ncbi:DIP1984 family protein [Paenibacillus caseinilyticus]|uniref:DIP1984 family protein n=1 Tax=Paenibacillus caseinilyticus TaxID=3098138 RepID=UPI0022B8DFD8|nr:DIP1984 family protein [Paenibacillus caseinilyticus]MCZ8519896.1 DIP1984 family protein [Paenibacillus caseinilyticus]
MKLAEALTLRDDCLKRIEQLKVRLARSTKVPEGELPGEKPEELLGELTQTLDRLESLITGIHGADAGTAYRGDASLAAVLAERDILAMRRTVVQSVIDAARAEQAPGGAPAGAKIVPAAGIDELQKQADGYAVAYRELDKRIRELNRQAEAVTIDG